MLKRVKIQNFKSIGEPGVDLELKPLTFLVGPNGGGKSSILDALALASQEVSPKTREGRPFFSYIRLEDLHFRHQPNTFTIQIEVSSNGSGEARSYTLSHIDNESELNMDEDRTEAERHFAGKVFPIRATRGNVEPVQSLPDRGDERKIIWVGKNGESTLTSLSRLLHARFTSRRSKVQKWALEFGMSNVAASLVSRERIEGSYSDNVLDTPLNLSDASSGSRQVLPVIVQTFGAEPDSVIMIEEPEISLHPELQVRLLEMFAEAVKEDKQIIATTHSFFLMEAIGYAVARGWLKSHDVAVYHIEKKKETGTVAKQLPMSEKGYIIGWIPSFTKVERKLVREWVKTLPEE
jgi:predicted ATPase